MGPGRSRSPAGRDRYHGHRRDDARYSRHRDRSRSPDRRHRDRDHRRDQRRYDSPPRRDERREQEYYRPQRRDRSRERRRSPPSRPYDRDGDRGRGYRDRDSKFRSDHHSRDRMRRSSDSHSQGQRSRRGSGHDEFVSKANGKPDAPSKPTEEEIKRQRLAKAEAWRQKQAALNKLETDRDNPEALRNVNNGKEVGDTAQLSAISPTTATSKTQSPANASPQKSPEQEYDPANYAGKFDPKAIMKKAGHSSKLKSAMTLDATDPLGIAETAKPDQKQKTAGKFLDTKSPTVAANTMKAQKPAASNLKKKGNMSRFGLSNKVDSHKAVGKVARDFEDEENADDEPNQLPLPETDFKDAVNSPEDMSEVEDADDADDADINMSDIDDQDEAETARAAKAAQERQERMLQESQLAANDTTDTRMKDTPQNSKVVDEDLDPLDAFMSGLTEPSENSPKSTKRPPRPQAVAFFGDEEEEDREAVTGRAQDELIEKAAKARAKKKDVPKINHAEKTYETLPNFYHPPDELANLSKEELSDLRLQYDDLKVKGNNLPAPVERWSQLGLDMFTLRTIQDLKYEAPTPIQRQAIPIVLSGRDLLAIAPTGSGKTIAFLIPLLRHIKVQPPLARGDGPQALIIAPTRELANQIFVAAKQFCKVLGLRVVSLTGGQNLAEDIADVKRGNNNMVVATAGRLVDILSANQGRVMNLWSRCTHLVLDEADRMLDMGFLPQVQKFTAQIRPAPYRNVSLWSATFNKKMETLARELLNKPVEVILGGRSTVRSEITQVVEVFHGDSRTADKHKMLRLLKWIGDIHSGDEKAQTLIFVDRHEEADALMAQIMKSGYPCDSIHGAKTQEDRTQALDDFRKGYLPVLVATSVAARGLDIETIKLVVNMEPPRFLEDVVHRAGRCARKPGTTGTAVTFFTEDQDRFARDTAKALKDSGVEIPEDLQKLCDSFSKKVEAGEAKWYSGGFGGKGLERLQEDRAATKRRERKGFKIRDENGNEIEAGADEEEEEAKEKKTKKEGEGEAKIQSSAAPPEQPKLGGLFEQFARDDANIRIQKTGASAQETKGQKLQGSHAAADRINARLMKTGDIRGNAPLDNKGPDAGLYYTTFAINDLPQKVRWACTNRSNTTKILDSLGVSITTKGTYIAPGEEIPAGEAKLTLLIEGDTENLVQSAVNELTRLRNDAAASLELGKARPGAASSGRYSVV